jgi:hypothetical protein
MEAAADVRAHGGDRAKEILDEGLIHHDQDVLEVEERSFLRGRGQLDESLVLPCEKGLLRGKARRTGQA